MIHHENLFKIASNDFQNSKCGKWDKPHKTCAKTQVRFLTRSSRSPLAFASQLSLKRRSQKRGLGLANVILTNAKAHKNQINQQTLNSSKGSTLEIYSEARTHKLEMLPNKSRRFRLNKISKNEFEVSLNQNLLVTRNEHNN